jgi:hypothetical protein
VSENGDNDQDRLSRLLREEGPVQAPPDLAPKVMRHVRAEPRRAPRRRLPSFVAPAAAALVLIAGVYGLSRLGTAGQSSAGSGAAGGVSAAAPNVQAPATSHANGGDKLAHAPSTIVRGVPQDALRHQALSASLRFCPANRTYNLWVPVATFDTVTQQLFEAAKTASATGTPGFDVRVAGRAVARPTLTCR